MKIRDKNIIVVIARVIGKEFSFYEIISYDTLQNILNKKVEFWEDGDKNFYSTSLTSSVSVIFDYLEDIERLIELEENNKEAELIVGKKKLIDKLNGKINRMNSYMDDKKITVLNKVIEELKK